MENKSKGNKMLDTVFKVIGYVTTVIRTLMLIMDIIKRLKNKHQKNNRTRQS